MQALQLWHIGNAFSHKKTRSFFLTHALFNPIVQSESGCAPSRAIEQIHGIASQFIEFWEYSPPTYMHFYLHSLAKCLNWILIEINVLSALPGKIVRHQHVWMMNDLSMFIFFFFNFIWTTHVWYLLEICLFGLNEMCICVFAEFQIPKYRICAETSKQTCEALEVEKKISATCFAPDG